MKIKSVVAAALVMALSISNTNAQVAYNTPNSNQRINQGIRSGELTRTEAANLRNDQKNIREDVKDARADGVVERHERNEMRHDKKHLNREIFRKKHNCRKRY